MNPLRCAALSDRGRVRPKNEDRWFADPEENLYLVSDGMGGQAAGELASRIVVELLPERLRQLPGGIENLWDTGRVDQVVAEVAALSDELREESQNQRDFKGMGATVVLLLVRGTQGLVVHMGDSRAYLLRDNRLDRLTKDHTLAQVLLDHGSIEEDEAAVHPGRSRLSRYMGMPAPALPEARQIELTRGDLVLLCTDGLTGMVDDDQLGTILAGEPDPKRACRRLIEAANAAGGKDNITALVVKIT